MITADTITDEQIRKLQSSTTDPQIAKCCSAALGVGNPIWSVRSTAREIVAAELNARAGIEVEHITTIHEEARGAQIFNQESHLYHCWSCSCGAVGPWGHALWARVSIKSATRSAKAHVENARVSRRSA